MAKETILGGAGQGKEVEIVDKETKWAYKIVGVCTGKSEPLGYYLYNLTTNQSKFTDAKILKQYMRCRPDFIQNAELVNNKIVLTECSEKRMTKYDTYGNPTEHNTMHIISKLQDRDSKEEIGYRIFKNGVTVLVNQIGLIELADSNRLVNGKIVHINNKKVISAIRGEFPVEVAAVIKKGARNKVKTDKDENKSKKQTESTAAANLRKEQHNKKVEEVLDRKIDYTSFQGTNYNEILKNSLKSQDLKWYLAELPEAHKKYVEMASNIVRDMRSKAELRAKDIQFLVSLVVREFVRADIDKLEVYKALENRYNWLDGKWVYRMPYFNSLAKLYPKEFNNIVAYKKKLMRMHGRKPIELIKYSDFEREIDLRIDDVDYTDEESFEKAGFTRNLCRHNHSVEGYRGEVSLKYCGYVNPYWDEIEDNVISIGDFMISTEIVALLLNNGFILGDSANKVTKVDLVKAEEFWKKNRIQNCYFRYNDEDELDKFKISLRYEDGSEKVIKVNKSDWGYLPLKEIRSKQISMNMSLLAIYNTELAEKMESFIKKSAPDFYETEYNKDLIKDIANKVSDGLVSNRVFYDSGARAIRVNFEKYDRKFVGKNLNLYNRVHKHRIRRNLRKKLDLSDHILNYEKELVDFLSGIHHLDKEEIASALSHATLKNIIVPD